MEEGEEMDNSESEEKSENEPDMEVEEEGKGEKPMSDHESDKEDESEDDKELNENVPPISGKHKKMTTLQEREQQDLEFPDEVDTPADQEAKVRFEKYKGLKSVKSTKWDPYENLPLEYAKVSELKNPVQSRKLAIAFIEKNGLKLAGMYVKFSIKGLKPEILANHPKEVPIV